MEEQRVERSVGDEKESSRPGWKSADVCGGQRSPSGSWSLSPMEILGVRLSWESMSTTAFARPPASQLTQL